ncbi:MAG: hypothetical protein GJT30_13815 [Geobacter sp.]|nr:hypothetical protein [Geobacter sp.]
MKHEPVKVAAIFEPAGVRPVWFARGARKYAVEQTTYTWQDRQGAETRLHFTITSGGELFELTYHTAGQRWTLAAIER